MTMQDIRRLEDETREELDRVIIYCCSADLSRSLTKRFNCNEQQRNQGTVRGMTADSD